MLVLRLMWLNMHRRRKFISQPEAAQWSLDAGRPLTDEFTTSMIVKPHYKQN